MQPLTYSRFQGWSSLFNWSYNAQETRLNALEKRLKDAIVDTKKYFKENRPWMGEPMALWSLENKLRAIVARTYAGNEYDRVEKGS